MRSSFLLPLFFGLLAACTTTTTGEQGSTTGMGGATSSSSSGTGAGGSETGGAPAALTAGWSLRDATPYARFGHTAILDEAGDRMIVFGGGANDTWQLPLSGPDAGKWSELVAIGDHPPPHPGAEMLFTDSAVYDPDGQRMIVLLDPAPATGQPSSDVALWELSLSGPPAWRQMMPAGTSPGSEIQSGHLVLDRAGHRLLVAGGALATSGVWALSLDGTPTWERVTDLPDTYVKGGFLNDASLLLDASRGQLLLFGGHPRLNAVWALSLADKTWTQISMNEQDAGAYGAAAVLDADHDQVVLFGGDASTGLAFFSLATHTWSDVDLGYSSHIAASLVLDAARGRALAFGGATSTAGGAVNTTWAIDLDGGPITELVPGTQVSQPDLGNYQAAWDPTRNAVVAFGSYFEGATLARGLGATDAFTSLDAGVTPQVSYTPAIYDPVGQAVWVFGGYGYTEQKEVARLSSAAGATWETLSVTDGPVERSQHAAVYDAANRRLVIHGGWRNSSYSPTELLDDTWALSLDGTPTWTLLVPHGLGQRHGHVAIYDPEGQRMITYGGNNGHYQVTDLWNLSLGDAPSWSLLGASGVSPGETENPSAVYDAVGKRMILVDMAHDGARVFALELGDKPAWHRYCWVGISPSAGQDQSPNAVIVGDGLFVSVMGAAFRFDLSTPYCD